MSIGDTPVEVIAKGKHSAARKRHQIVAARVNLLRCWRPPAIPLVEGKPTGWYSTEVFGSVGPSRSHPLIE